MRRIVIAGHRARSANVWRVIMSSARVGGSAGSLGGPVAADEEGECRWDPVELDGHALVVADGPVLGDQSVDDPLEVGLTDGERLAGGRERPLDGAIGRPDDELAGLASRERPVGHGEVALDDHTLGGPREIAERYPEPLARGVERSGADAPGGGRLGDRLAVDGIKDGTSAARSSTVPPRVAWIERSATPARSARK